MKKGKNESSKRMGQTARAFRRVTPERLAKPEDMRPRNTKVRVTMYLDLDVFNYFKGRAAPPHAAPYQTQINSVLREIMERDDNGGSSSSLIDDDRFIAAVAERVRELRKHR